MSLRRRSATATARRWRGRSRWSSRPAPITGEQAQELLLELMPEAGSADARRHHRRARSRQVDRHRGARDVPHRAGTPGRGAGRRPVVHPHRRLDPRRQDPDGAAGGPSRRLHPAVTDLGHARRRREGDPRDDRVAGSRRVRRHPGRDRRRRSVRGDGCQHGRHLRVPDPGPHRRPTAGHQEGRARARRHRRGQQGRRRARGGGQGRRAGTRPVRSA